MPSEELNKQWIEERARILNTGNKAVLRFGDVVGLVRAVYDVPWKYAPGVGWYNHAGSTGTFFQELVGYKTFQVVDTPPWVAVTKKTLVPWGGTGEVGPLTEDWLVKLAGLTIGDFEHRLVRLLLPQTSERVAGQFWSKGEKVDPQRKIRIREKS